ncbi:MAG: efflux transporter outer membrane subunit [Planctomycetes bacterium]|nr:efflux transporter outer membrane subunit [Planctomycetota bacterium]
MSTMHPRLPASPKGRSRIGSTIRKAACGATFLLAGCTPLKEYVHNGFKVGPNYQRPAAPVAPDWIDAADIRVSKDPEELSRWWTVFNDPVLNALVCDAYRQNLTLREAGFRVLQARAQLGIARGEFFPQTQVATGSFNQRAVSVEVANRNATPDRFFATWAYGFGLNWELDFWGRFRRAIESSAAQLDASVAEYDDVLVTLLGDIATAYVQLRTQEQQLEYLKTNVKLQRDTLSIAKAQFKGGQVSELDPDQSQSTLSQTESQVPQQEIQIRQTTNRLCVLLGIPPEDLQKRLGAGAIPTAPPEVVANTPADLLRRRPDVRRNEREAASRAAQIGIAEADFYPAISIVGAIGAGSQDISHLFVSQAMTGSIGPSFQWNVLNYGRILNNVRVQDAAFLERVARYQQSVLKANAEVEDGLITFLKAHERVKALIESVKAAEKAVKAAVVQYSNGLIDYNRVDLLQENLVSQQNQLAQAQGEIALGLIQTYKAMGGGWEIRKIGCEGPACAVPQPPLLPAPMQMKNAVDALRGPNAVHPAGGVMPASSQPIKQASVKTMGKVPAAPQDSHPLRPEYFGQNPK